MCTAGFATAALARRAPGARAGRGGWTPALNHGEHLRYCAVERLWLTAQPVLAVRVQQARHAAGVDVLAG